MKARLRTIKGVRSHVVNDVDLLPWRDDRVVDVYKMNRMVIKGDFRFAAV